MLETPQRASRPPSSAPPAPQAAVSAADSIATGMLDERPSVVLSDTLAAALGTSTMSLRQLLDVGTNHADPAIRSQAVREAVDALQAVAG
jgi:hypothetical protein